MKHLYTARDAMEAHFVRGLLEARGIDAVVQGEALGAARGSLPVTQETLPSVWVLEHDFDEAAEVLREYREGGPAEMRLPWRCTRCGEASEGQFSHCWRCGTERGEGIEPLAAEPIEGPLPLDYEHRHRDIEEFEHPSQQDLHEHED